MEGPSLVIFKEQLQAQVGQKVRHASGSSLYRLGKFKGWKLKRIRTWGKQIFFFFEGGILRIHFLLFGSYSLDQKKPNRKPRLSLYFPTGSVHFYACALRMVESQEVSKLRSTRDIMSPSWDKNLAFRSCLGHPDEYICDILLDQNLFAGVGNIIKNEVLYLIRKHPLTRVRDLEMRELKEMIRQARLYSKKFYRWKKKFVLRKHWKVMRKGVCPSCGGKITNQTLGKRQRRCFFCPRCQPLFSPETQDLLKVSHSRTYGQQKFT